MLDLIYLVKDPEDLLQVVLGLLFILPLHHQVDKFKEVHSAWAVLVSLLKLSWQNSGFRNQVFTSISSSSSSSVGEHPIDRITAPNSFVDTVPSPSCIDDFMKTTTCWGSSPCRTSWTSAWNSPAARRWWTPWYSFHQTLQKSNFYNSCISSRVGAKSLQIRFNKMSSVASFHVRYLIILFLPRYEGVTHRTIFSCHGHFKHKHLNNYCFLLNGNQCNEW